MNAIVKRKNGQTDIIVGGESSSDMEKFVSINGEGGEICRYPSGIIESVLFESPKEKPVAAVKADGAIFKKKKVE